MINQLDALCSRALNIIFSPGEDASNDVNKTTSIVVDLTELHSEIMSHVPDYPPVEHLTAQQLEDFSLPPPYFHTHPVSRASISVLKDKLREIITNLSGKSHRHKRLSGRRSTAASRLSQDSGTLDHEYISSTDDDVASSKSCSMRPASAPTSRIHSISEADDAHNHPEALSVPTSPLPRCRSPTSPTVSFHSSPQEPFDDPSSSDPSESASINSNTSTSRSRSQSPTSSENGSSFLLTNSSLHRGSIPEYGSGNRVRADSFARRFSAPGVHVTRTGTLVRLQKKNGINTIRPVRKKSIALQSCFPKVLKIVLAGDDKMVNNVAGAYTELRYVCSVCVCVCVCMCVCVGACVRVCVYHH